jgi:hypothetical protein
MEQLKSINPTWKAVAGVTVIFILGCVIGTLGTLVAVKHKSLALQRNPEALAIVLERQTTRNLGLDADKKQQIHGVFLQYIRQRLDLQRSIQPQVHAVNAQTLQQIDGLLTADQQQKFHENLVLFKTRFDRNPFNVGTDDKSAQAEQVGAGGDGGAAPAK